MSIIDINYRLYFVNILMKMNKFISMIHGRNKIFMPMLWSLKSGKGYKI